MVEYTEAECSRCYEGKIVRDAYDENLLFCNKCFRECVIHKFAGVKK